MNCSVMSVFDLTYVFDAIVNVAVHQLVEIKEADDSIAAKANVVVTTCIKLF